MKKICFFNHYHNGDVFHSKSFIKEIIDSMEFEFSYAHSNDPVLLSDLNLQHIEVPNIHHKLKFFEDGDTFYINTWIGSYFDEGMKYLGECTLRFSYEMFSKIYDELNNRFNSNLKLNSIENYFPSIDWNKFYISKVDEYLAADKNQKILFSNGPCLSGQCRYYGNMDLVINSLADKYPNITFIVTQGINTHLENVKTSSDIIGKDGCDLNEIGYLSKYCDIIVGRNSGPFCFCTHDQNINNETLTFYAFGEDITTCFPYEIDLDCKFIFEYFNDLETIKDSIDKLISKL